MRKRKPQGGARHYIHQCICATFTSCITLREDDTMKMFATAASLCLAMVTGTAIASSEPTEKDAIAMVEKGAATMKSKGKDELMKRIMAKDPEFVQPTLYLYLRDPKNGVLLVHPMNPTLIGKDLIDVPDTNGKKYRREIVDVAAKQGKGWVDYTYKNPATGKVEPKNTYFR
jgi:signal transduction histidine kinase